MSTLVKRVAQVFICWPIFLLLFDVDKDLEAAKNILFDGRWIYH